MAITAGEVINLARDAHASLSVQSTPKPVMLRRISEEQRTLFDMIFSRVPGLLAQVLTVPLPLADFDAGIDLTTEIPGGWKDLTPSAEFQFSDRPPPAGVVKVGFVPFEQRLQSRSLPAITFRDNTIFLLGSANNYNQFSEVRIPYTPIPADVTAETSVLELPDDARGVLAARLASVSLRRLVGNPLYGVSMAMWREYDGDAAGATSSFLRRLVQGIGQRQDYHVNIVT